MMKMKTFQFSPAFNSNTNAFIQKKSQRLPLLLSLLYILSLVQLPNSTSSFSSPEGGWTSRPLVPELARNNANQEDKNIVSPANDEKAITSKNREPWDAFRFVKQSSQFITILPKPFLQPLIVNPGDTLWQPGTSTTTTSSGTSSAKMRWGSLDDVVMGGVSASTIDNETGMWKGTVSSANSGGFVGIRTMPFTSHSSYDMSNCSGIQIRFLSYDSGTRSKRFKAVLRDSTDFNGVCWTTSFDAKGRGGSSNPFWKKLLNDGSETNNVQTANLPFDKQIPAIFARTVPDVTFDSSNVVGFQLAYSKFEYDGEFNPNFELGDFSLQLLEIKAI
mmetsp:Transcript_8796/g.12492  ORF Transcript_8796/g.12492 Transcript_8796/m.12492 type:complete len:332 (+) Transcript_8796:72-1067(+)